MMGTNMKIIPYLTALALIFMSPSAMARYFPDGTESPPKYIFDAAEILGRAQFEHDRCGHLLNVKQINVDIAQFGMQVVEVRAGEYMMLYPKALQEKLQKIVNDSYVMYEKANAQVGGPIDCKCWLENSGGWLVEGPPPLKPNPDFLQMKTD